MDSVSALRRDGFRRGVDCGAVAGKRGVSLWRGGEVCARIALGRQIGGVAAICCVDCLWQCEES